MTSRAGLVLEDLVPSVASEAVRVVEAGLLTVLSVTLNAPVPAASAVSAGRCAPLSLDSMCTVSLTLGTTLKNWSTALTVPWNAPLTYSIFGVPVLPVKVPGAADSPGTNNWSWLNGAGFTVRAKA